MRKIISIFVSILIIMSLVMSVSAFTTVIVKGIKLDKSSINLKIGQTYTLKVSFTPLKTTQKGIRFTVSNKNVASVDTKGKITALKAGNAVIMATSLSNSKVIAKCSVNVTALKNSKIVLLGYKGGSEAGSLPKTIEDFMKEFPNIKAENVYIGTSNGYYDVLKARLAANEKVDVFMSAPNFHSIWVNAGYARDLSNKSFSEQVLDSMKAQFSTNGKLYAFPTHASGMGLMVNKKILKDNGLNTPTNWTEFLKACTKLKEAKVLPMLMGNKDGWSAGNFVKLTMLIENKDNKNFGSDLASQKIKFTDIYVKHFKKLQTMVDNDYINAEESLGLQWNQQALTDFVNGKAAFMMGGTWMIPQITKADANFDFELVPLPTQDSGPATSFIFPGAGLYVNAKSKEADASLVFLSYFSRKEVQGEWVKSQAAYSPIKGGISSDEPKAKLFADTIASGNAASWQPEEENLKVIDELYKKVQLMMLKKETPETAAAGLDEVAAKNRELNK